MRVKVGVSEGVGAVLRSLPPNPNWSQVQSRPLRGLNVCLTFFPAEVHSGFDPPEVGKMSTSMDRIERLPAAYMCFRSAGGKLIIVIYGKGAI